MPWEIRQRDGRYCVYKENTDELSGCHDTRGEAERQLSALYASEPEAGKAQSDAPNYRFVGTDEPERCQTCRFAEGMRCTAFDFTFQAGYTCDAWESIESERGYTEEMRKASYTYNGVTVTATQRRPSSRDDKKYERTVTVDGKDYLVHYGDPNMEMQRDIPERRANFLSRHNCSAKRDPLAPGFWACLDWQRTSEGKSVDGDDMDSNALKAISKTDTELRVGNYMVLFGGRDLEGVLSPRRNQDGSAGEYFTKSTAFDSQYTDVDLLAVDWEHGYGELGKDEVLGRVDWKTARIDDKGLFVERVLNRRNRYVKYLEELIEAGLIGNSSEAVSDGVEKAPNGEIVRWPLRRDTLTVTPMEPRMITENAITAIKALSERYPALKSLLPAEDVSDAETVEPKTDDESVVAVADDTERRRIEIELELLAI